MLETHTLLVEYIKLLLSSEDETASQTEKSGRSEGEGKDKVSLVTQW